MGVRKFTNGDVELDFYHEDKITEYRYSFDSSRLRTFPKELADILANTLALDICIELEECDDESTDL